jgi:hypothetical protein
LERLDALARATPHDTDGFALTPAVTAGLGWAPEPARRILRALGFAPARETSEAELWRRRLRPAASNMRSAAPTEPVAEPAPAVRRARRRFRRRSAS